MWYYHLCFFLMEQTKSSNVSGCNFWMAFDDLMLMLFKDLITGFGTHNFGGFDFPTILSKMDL